MTTSTAASPTHKRRQLTQMPPQLARAASPSRLDMQPEPCQTSQKTRLIRGIMHTWSVQYAKARSSEFLDACLVEGPQMVTKRGAEAAVLMPMQEWRRFQAAARPSLKQLLLSVQARCDFIVPAR